MDLEGLLQFKAIIDALGWTLVHFIWQGFVIGAIFWLAMSINKQSSSNARYWAGLICYLLCVLIPILTFGYYYQPVQEVVATAAGSTMTVLGGVSTMDFGLLLRSSIESALPVLVIVWGLGVAILSIRTAFAWKNTRELLRVGVSPAGADLVSLTEQLKQQIGVKQTVKLLRSTKVLVPTVIGWLKPVILLPVSVISRLPAEQLEMVIAHELGHIRRYDYLVNLFQLVIDTLFFYHPAVRWMSKRIRQEREVCCDDLVLSHYQQPVVYVKALANLECLRGDEPIPALAATGGDLFERVRRIVRGDRTDGQGGYAQAALAFLVAAIVGLGAHQGLNIGQKALEAENASIAQSGQDATEDQIRRSSWGMGIQRFASMVKAENQRVEEERLERERLAAERAQAEEAARLAAIQQEQQTQARLLESQKSEVVVANEQPVEETAAPIVEDVLASAQAPTMDVGNVLDELNQSAADELAAAELALSSPLDTVTEQVSKEPEGSLLIKPLQTSAPVYPLRAQKQGIEGYAKVTFSVTASGRVKDVEVVDAYPEKIFDRAAKNAIRLWRFEVPEGLNKNLRITQTFDFVLKDVEGEKTIRRSCDRTGSRICDRWDYNKQVVYVNPPKPPRKRSQ